jgi:hypothetical protein
VSALPNIVAAHARAAVASASATEALWSSDLVSLPATLRRMGRAMPVDVETAWLAAVEARDVDTVRALAIQLATPRITRGRALLLAIVDTTGAALSLRDVSTYYAATGALPYGGAS